MTKRKAKIGVSMRTPAPRLLAQAPHLRYDVVQREHILMTREA